MFCSYLLKVLYDKTVFDKATLKSIKRDIKRLRKYQDPYMYDDIYDNLSDLVIEWSVAKNGLIPRKIDPKQYR